MLKQFHVTLISLALLAGVFSVPGGVFASMDVPLDLDSWDKYSPVGGSANWEITPDGLRFYGSGFRQGTDILSKMTDDFTYTAVRIKWMAHGGDGYNFAGFYVGVGWYEGGLVLPAKQGSMTTHHSWEGSLVIADDTWYYTTITITPDQQVTAITSTGNYADMGGSLFYTGTYSIAPEDWAHMSNASLCAEIWDNYAGTTTWMTIGEASDITLPPAGCQIVNRVLWKDIDQGWLNSRIDVESGDKGVVTVQGFSNVDTQGLGWQGWVGPGGYPEDAGGGGIIPDAPLQSVIYKIGESGTEHYLGTGGGNIIFDADGELMFGINNNNPGNSDGAFLFTVVLEGECPDIPDGLLGDLSGDGTVSAYDAALILQYCVGLIDKFPIEKMSAAKRAVPAIYELRIPNSSVKADELLIRVPITINNGDSLTAGAFKIKYDSSVLRAVGITPRFMLNGAYWQARIDEEKSEIRFAFAKSSPTKQSNDAALALLEFEPIGDVEGMTTDLVFHDVQIAESISIKNINGSITFLPRQSALLQNYPNPFNPETWIPYQLATDSPLTIHIYNTKGQLVRTISLGNKDAGVYTTKGKAAYWDGKDSLGQKVASGVYFYTLMAGEFMATRKMLILK